MKANIFFVASLFAFLISTPTFGQTESDEEILTVPEGTALKLILQEELYSQRNAAGDAVLFTLAEDIVLMGKTYLVAGTPVLGRLIEVKCGKSWGRSGSIQIEIASIQPPYGMPIPVIDELGATERSKTGKTIVGVMAFGIIGGGAIKGKKITIPAGTEMNLFTSKDGQVLDIPVEEMTRYVDEWFENEIKRNFLSFTWKNKSPVRTVLAGMGYDADELEIVIEPIEDFYYELKVHLTDNEFALFNFRPFDDVHENGTGFKPLKGTNDLGSQIMGRVK